MAPLSTLTNRVIPQQAAEVGTKKPGCLSKMTSQSPAIKSTYACQSIGDFRDAHGDTQRYNDAS